LPQGRPDLGVPPLARWRRRLKSAAGSSRDGDRTSVGGTLRPGGTERSDPRALLRLVLRRGAPAGRGAAGRSLRGMRPTASESPDAVLFPKVPMEVPRALLLGFRPIVRDAAGPLSMPDLRGAQASTGTGRRPYRRDRPGRSRSRILEPANGVQGVPPRQNARIPPHRETRTPGQGPLAEVSTLPAHFPLSRPRGTVSKVALEGLQREGEAGSGVVQQHPLPRPHGTVAKELGEGGVRSGALR
jgi:hypothetical protein